MAADHLNFDQVQKRREQANRELLVLLANQAQNYFLSSWKKQGFDGKPWKEVQRRIEGTNSYKYPIKKGLQRRTKPILIGSGYKKRGATLMRAVSNMSRTAKMNIYGFRMVVDLPYASRHNDGLAGMPQRRYIGQTQELTRMQEQLITRTINKIWAQ